MRDGNTATRTAPGYGLALAPFLLLIALFSLGSLYMPAGDPLIVLCMLGAATLASVIAIYRGSGWSDIQTSAIEKFAAVFPIILILLAIGALIGAWVLSGTIPLFVWLGLKLINPDYIALTAFLAAALMSIFTGTSWGSAGTVGVALMGIAVAVGAPLPMVAGAVVSGAYFGDKMSPLSDSTNVAALSAGTDIYTHIRHMTYTAVPSFCLAVLVFTLAAGGDAAGADVQVEATTRMIASIEAAFRLEWYVVIPPILIFVAILRRWPPVLGIAGAAAAGAVVGVLGQGFSVTDGLAALTVGFDASMIHSASFLAQDVSESFDTLVNRGGIYSMVNVLVVIIAAFLLAGAMDVSGSLDVLVGGLLKAATSIVRLVAATMISGVMLLSLSSHGGVSCLIVGGLFQQGYREKRLAPENLSRSLEDSVTLMDPLLPWTVSGLFMANTLGVATLDYLPWAVFCLGGPVFSILLAATFKRTKFGMNLLPNS